MQRSPRRGSILALMAISMTGLLGLTGLAVDAGYMRLASARVQSATDAAALAALSALPDTDEAEVRAQAVLDHYALGDHTFTLDTETMEVGSWDADASAFTESDDGSGSAVRLTMTLDSLPSFFAQFVGVGSFSVTRTAVVARGGSAGPCGILAETSLVMSGVPMVDSFDSSEGPYSYADASDNGNICSNGDLALYGVPYVYGSAYYYDDVTEYGRPRISGDIEELPAPIDLPTVDSSDAKRHNDNNLLGSRYRRGRALRLSGRRTLKLSAGTYYFSSIKVSGRANIRVTGEVHIYTDGDVSFTGTSFTNVDGDPLNLTLYVDGANDVKVTGSGEYIGQIIAPESALKFSGGADIQGRIVGDKIKISGTPYIHFDEATLDESEQSSSATTFAVVE